MCEWLSYGEWCDVKLLCGGRAFSAHRVVLASVSNFLRHLLLSCPTDESPTFIVLPEFDLEAMSSVLYYIYNGEVIVQKQKLEMFLDIIKAMQIFIDSQYLPQTVDINNINSHIDFNGNPDMSKRNVFTLGYEGARDQRYFNLKKGDEIQDVLLQYSVSNSDSNDKVVRSQNPSGERKASLGNLKSPYGDRQRNSFLRDLFIETYPRNGNVNGLMAGVLAISNECYRAPASALLTNANGKHLSNDDILLEPNKKTGEQISNSPPVFQLRKQQQCTRNEQDYGETSKYFTVANICSTEKVNNKYLGEIAKRNVSKNYWMSHMPNSVNSLYQVELRKQILSGFYVPSSSCSVSPSMIDSVKNICAHRNKFSESSNCILSNERQCKEDTTSTSKITILNHVMDNPWSPRIPNNYKPFRRKIEKSLQSPICDQKELDKIAANDNNNNVERSQVPANLIKKSIDEITCTHTIQKNTTITAAVGQADDFKCTVCNQVFTTNEMLTSHMRRHSTNARYTCGECGKTFSQLRNFKYHMSIHRGTREFAATCSVCGKYFNDRGYLSSHMKIHRNRKEYKCSLCPKSFNQRVAYNMHVRIHTGVKPHVCEQCGKAFSRKMLLKQHQRTHSGERPYACSHCDKRFADRSNMTLHLRLHTGIKPFSCTLCPKSFTKKHHLKSHLNFHTGSKPYTCPRCNLAFTQSSNMRTHMKKCRAPETLPDTGNQQIV